MSESQDPVWAEIERAKLGDPEAQGLFVRRYEPVIWAYLASRWRATPLAAEIDDALQEVMLDFVGGALARADPERPFRPFLYGVARNVARRVEERRACDRARPLAAEQAAALEANDASASVVFDRAWAQALVKEAKALQARSAVGSPAALRRVELLDLRFGHGLPIRAIAERFGEDPDRVHRQYAQARVEFLRALQEVVRRHQGGSGSGIEAECRRLLACFA